MKTKTSKHAQQLDLIQTMVSQAMASLNDRRGEQRFPFFKPVTVAIQGKNDQAIEGFSKDISESGIGLLTHVPLPDSQTISMCFENEIGDWVELKGEVVWSNASGKGWYTAGIRFC